MATRTLGLGRLGFGFISDFTEEVSTQEQDGGTIIGDLTHPLLLVLRRRLTTGLPDEDVLQRVLVVAEEGQFEGRKPASQLASQFSASFPPLCQLASGPAS